MLPCIVTHTYIVLCKACVAWLETWEEMCVCLKTHLTFSLELTNKAKGEPKHLEPKENTPNRKQRVPTAGVKMKLEASLEDMSEWRELDFAMNCTYIVQDQACEPSFRLPKAMTSIPRNLTFQYSADNQVRIPSSLIPPSLTSHGYHTLVI